MVVDLVLRRLLELKSCHLHMKNKDDLYGVLRGEPALRGESTYVC